VPCQVGLDSRIEPASQEEVDTSVLFSQVVVDKQILKEKIRRNLSKKDHLTLARLLETEPLEEGLAELMAYLSLAEEDSYSFVSHEERDHLEWTDSEGVKRRALMPRIHFSGRAKPSPSVPMSGHNTDHNTGGSNE
jgi:hypothetical protein